MSRRVLIHAVALQKQGGASRHLRGFLCALHEIDPSSEYVLCLEERFAFVDAPPNVRVRRVHIGSQLQRLWWDQVELPRIVRAEGAEALLALLVFGAIAPPCPQISFQRNPVFFCPEYLSGIHPYSSHMVELRARRVLAYWTMRASTFIVVPSEAMREMIRTFYPQLPRSRFAVVPHAFEPADIERAQPLDRGIADMLGSRSPDVPRLAYVSHLEPHKGFDVLFEAARKLAAEGEPFSLATTIDPRDGTRDYESLALRIHALGGRVVNLGRVPEDQIVHVYRATDVFVFPSLCESFGFPMKEALTSGLPVVAADTAINREICGSAAVYYPAHDAGALAQALRDLLADPKRRNAMRAAARARAEESAWSWRDYARRIVGLIDKLSAGRQR